jgi:hypothetical protein
MAEFGHSLHCICARCLAPHALAYARLPSSLACARVMLLLFAVCSRCVKNIFELANSWLSCKWLPIYVVSGGSDEPAKLVPPHENDAINDILDGPCQVISAALVGGGRIVDICTPGYTADNHSWTSGDAVISVARGLQAMGLPGGRVL